jgi:hypothetical protein
MGSWIRQTAVAQQHLIESQQAVLQQYPPTSYSNANAGMTILHVVDVFV